MRTRRRRTGRYRQALKVRLAPTAALVVAVALIPMEIRSELQVSDPCAEGSGNVLRTARALADSGEADPAAALLDSALLQCPDHPELLAGLAGVRVLKGEWVEAETLSTHLVRIHPDSSHGWDLLALTRYLQDDADGALRAWSQVGRPLVQSIDVRILGHSGPRASEAGTDPDRVSGIAEGRMLTGDALVRGERRLGALPAAERARLGYRMLPGGQAAVEGTVVLGSTDPLTRTKLVVNAFRLLGRRVHLVSADPLNRLERWEASGSMEGTLRKAGLTLAHPAPRNSGVWRWELDHEKGRYESAGLEDAVRETRTSLGWSHTDWFTSTLRGSVHSRVEVRPERGTFVGAGAGWTFLPQTTRGAVGVEGTGWLRLGSGSSVDRGQERETQFGRAEVRGVFHAIRPETGGRRTGWVGPPTGQGGVGVGLDIRGGAVAVSRGIPSDLMPRIGAGGNAHLLMRARSDLDDRGVVRPLFPGTAWAHGGIEVHRPVAVVGPVVISGALFADAVKVLTPLEGSDIGSGRRGAVHLGGGIRARIPWVEGWFRADWGIDPSDGDSTFSAAWVREFRLHRLSAH